MPFRIEINHRQGVHFYRHRLGGSGSCLSLVGACHTSMERLRKILGLQLLAQLGLNQGEIKHSRLHVISVPEQLPHRANHGSGDFFGQFHGLHITLHVDIGQVAQKTLHDPKAMIGPALAVHELSPVSYQHGRLGSPLNLYQVILLDRITVTLLIWTLQDLIILTVVLGSQQSNLQPWQILVDLR